MLASSDVVSISSLLKALVIVCTGGVGTILVLLIKHSMNGKIHVPEKETFVTTSFCNERYDKGAEDRKKIRKGLAVLMAIMLKKEHKIPELKNAGGNLSVIFDAQIEALNGDHDSEEENTT